MKHILARFGAALVILAGLYATSWLLDLSRGEPQWSVSFSPIYAERDLKLDARETYAAILDELEPPRLRLIAYWNRMEPERGAYRFDELDWQFREAEARNIAVILAIGYRTPRWPECHIPEWAANLPTEEFETALTDYLTALVEHYKASPAIRIWQVENEPFLSVFGECPPPIPGFLEKEIALVRGLDPSRTIMTTDSGELSFWPRGAGTSEIFGTTLYRYVWNKYTGFFTHLYPPAFYALRGWLTTAFSRTTKIMIAELQAEPWATGGRKLGEVPIEEQTEQFGLGELEGILDFAKRTGIRDIYLWGPEWWYWRKLNGDPSFWEVGKRLFH